eukprot:scaffold18638_cov52-Attheya_sp.AAC.1
MELDDGGSELAVVDPETDAVATTSLSLLVDAAGSCGSNPGCLFRNGRLVVDIMDDCRHNASRGGDTRGGGGGGGGGGPIIETTIPPILLQLISHCFRGWIRIVCEALYVCEAL